MENRIIQNTEFLKWYYSDIDLYDSKQQQLSFAILSNAYIEDSFAFFRICLFIANKRVSQNDELKYRTIIHFVGTFAPEQALANIDLIIKFGKKDDILYFIQCPPISERSLKILQHFCKSDSSYNKLIEGRLIQCDITSIIQYNLVDNNYIELLKNILQDAELNGLC